MPIFGVQITEVRTYSYAIQADTFDAAEDAAQLVHGNEPSTTYDGGVESTEQLPVPPEGPVWDTAGVVIGDSDDDIDPDDLLDEQGNLQIH